MPKGGYVHANFVEILSKKFCKLRLIDLRAKFFDVLWIFTHVNQILLLKIKLQGEKIHALGKH